MYVNTEDAGPFGEASSQFYIASPQELLLSIEHHHLHAVMLSQFNRRSTTAFLMTHKKVCTIVLRLLYN